ncbi:hypothetical protein CC78DRAFT_532485 [Lojkania enalia]|uniref:Cyanovirin-N domain-containing protein n=1 Tax=Lojkania enalia TaxID=147567 RepID=A0A9P4N6Z4_9PLEO|nr:hypothetical protein CC78DRAFT_532485 [Didymosphaeria enalia]
MHPLTPLLLLPLTLALPQPENPTPTLPAILLDRQATPTTFYGTCHTSTPTNNIPRGICTVTSPAPMASAGLLLGCNSGTLSSRLLNCTSDGSIGMPWDASVFCANFLLAEWSRGF